MSLAWCSHGPPPTGVVTPQDCVTHDSSHSLVEFVAIQGWDVKYFLLFYSLTAEIQIGTDVTQHVCSSVHHYINLKLLH